MSNLLPQIDVTIVDSVATLQSLLDNINGLAVNPPSLYLDLEGVKLGRHGSISILSLYAAPLRKAYLIDIHVLGKNAFSTSKSSTDSSPATLKTIFESPNIPKVIFDLRNDSDALFSHFEISLAGIRDLQLMELATRRGSKEYVAGLAKCIERDSGLSAAVKAEWSRTKQGASHLYDPKKGGRYEIFNERPMRAEIIQYCARDVALLPALYQVYYAELSKPGNKFWEVKVQGATVDRVKQSQSADYDGQASNKVCGPWNASSIEQEIESWNDDIIFEAQIAESEFDFDPDDYDADYDDWLDQGDSARDCIGWEEDMIKNGEDF